MEFSRDLIWWLEFWAHFETAVDQLPIVEVQKLNYLLRCLKGVAERTVAGYAVTGGNYGAFLTYLSIGFTNKRWIRHELYKDLAQLRCGNGKDG